MPIIAPHLQKEEAVKSPWHEENSSGATQKDLFARPPQPAMMTVYSTNMLPTLMSKESARLSFTKSFFSPPETHAVFSLS